MVKKLRVSIGLLQGFTLPSKEEESYEPSIGHISTVSSLLLLWRDRIR